MSISKAAVCLIACHGGPADHFATFAQKLSQKGCEVQIHATGPALQKIKERRVNVQSSFSLDNLTPEEEDGLAQGIAKICSKASLIITDVGHVFDIKIQKALMNHAAQIPRLAYYDNPEPFVPGGYSSTASQVMQLAQGILFANETLSQSKIYSAAGIAIDFSDKKRFGIGYYPVHQAEKIAEKRTYDHDRVRSEFLIKNGIEDKGQKVWVYFGGNNEEYFLKAFPAFLSIIAEASSRIDLKNNIIVIQQHPGAKVKNQDGQQVAAWLKEREGREEVPRVIVSDFSSDYAQVLADAALYYQTSMGPQFALGGIPTVQIGHETYDDILVRNHIAPTVTNTEQLIQSLETLDTMKPIPKQELLKSLGIKEAWAEALEAAIMQSI